ncbi:MAG: calcium/sodium antiporter [Erysipelotrichaceae bacterium]
MILLIQLTFGFTQLVYGAHIFVSVSSTLAKKLGISSLIIGLTIVAFGTSSPELAVSITAGLKEVNEIALGNVLGSNIFNLLVVLGLCCLINPLQTDEEVLKRDWPASIITTIVVFAMIIFDHSLSRLNALLLLLGLIILTFNQIKTSKDDSETESTIKTPVIKIILYMIMGFILIELGSDISVKAAIKIAESFNLSETFIGLTIISIGTSLPELVTSLVATNKKEYGIAIGNVIGSNLINLLCVLAVTCLLNPIPILNTAIVDTFLLLIITILLYFAAKHHKLSKMMGCIMVFSYLLYTIYLFIR